MRRYIIGLCAVLLVLVLAGSYVGYMSIRGSFTPSTGANESATAGTGKTSNPTAEEQAAAEPAPAIDEQYDLVLIGSEIEGVLMAKAAHDEGQKVLILDPREKPGGQLLQGQMLVLDEPNNNKKISLVQGEMKKLYNAYNGGEIRKEQDFIKYYDGLVEGIPLKSGIKLGHIQQDEQGSMHKVDSITYTEQDGSQHTVGARYFVENTDYAALTSQLDAKRIPGVESIFSGHASKPEYMAATYMLRFKHVDWLALHSATLLDYPLTRLEAKYGTNTYVDYDFGTGFNKITDKFQIADSQLKLRGINSTYQKDGEVIINALLIYDVDPSNPESVQKAIAKGRAEAPRVLEFLRENIPGYKRAELNGYPDYLYIRDYNRYETDYVLQADDLMNSTMFWDNVSIGGYPLDVQGTREVPTGKGYGKPDAYGIPLRSFELKDYDNVLVAGKNIGASIKAYGSARITPTTALAAQTIGIILGREGKEKKLRDLTKEDFEHIHDYLRTEYRISLK
ncbi:FAD-dependent oxidoreductase [Paenibacillus hunanensis]|uniref:FAD-dependent oxidoreductase n=1 Tax=Paenibacillus hunanensis TaxID=539262 RepID=UPI0020265E61|nr:FAD-dependent oxidoreductase [Paenibacillus hunanensis]MCL9659102.1 FAD-dependent oxidoreductase [Paenibacillus hunanensis]